MDYKELAKIAKACRKAGIKSYKCADFEFTLSDEEPMKIRRTRESKGNSNSLSDLRPDKLDIEELDDESLLLWSAGAGARVEGLG